MDENKPTDRERIEALTESAKLLLAKVREQAVHFERALGEIISVNNTNAQRISALWDKIS